MIFFFILDPKSSMEVIGITALACGLICVGTCNEDVTTTLLQILMEKNGTNDLKDSFAKFLPLGIGLCYLAKQEQAEATVATLEVLEDPFKSMAMTMVDICAYAGTGNVLKIQSLLHICSEHFEPEKEKESDKKDKKNKTETAATDKKAAGAEAEKKIDSPTDLSRMRSTSLARLSDGA